MLEESQALIDYKCRAEEYVKAKRIMKDISTITADVSRCLTTEPYRLTISGFGMDIPLSPNFAGKPLVCSPEQWPTAETLAETVNRLYRAEKALRKAWDKLSPQEQMLVEAPPAA